MTATKNPVGAGDTNRARNTDHAAVLIASEYATPSIDIQRFRAAWIARRVPVSPQIALFVASLHFGESAQ